MKISNCFYNSFWILNFHECFHFTFLIDPLLLFSRSVGQSHGLQHCLWPHRLQHTRLPCPSPPPGVCSDSCPSSRWCHPTISFSVIPFSSCPQSSPASGGFSSESALHIRSPKYWHCGLIPWFTWELSLPFCLQLFLFYLLKSNSIPTIETTLRVAKDFHSAILCVCVCVCLCVWRGEDMNQNEKHLMSLTINFLTVSPWWSPPDSSFIPESTSPLLLPPLFLLGPWSVSGLCSALPFLSTLLLTEFTHSFSTCSQPLWMVPPK